MERKTIVREVKISDIPQIIKIGKSTKEFEVDKNFKGSFWSEKQLKNWCKSDNDVLLIAEMKKDIVGFVFFAHHVPTGKATFENAWVREDFRKTGLANDLLKKGIEELKKKEVKYLCSLAKTNNLASIKFLEKNNFMKGFNFSWLHRKL